MLLDDKHRQLALFGLAAGGLGSLREIAHLPIFLQLIRHSLRSLSPPRLGWRSLARFRCSGPLRRFARGCAARSSGSAATFEAAAQRFHDVHHLTAFLLF